MSIKCVRKFSQIVENNTEIQKSLEAKTDRESLINLAVQIGSEIGLSFTADEVNEYYTEERRKIERASNSIFPAILSNTIRFLQTTISAFPLAGGMRVPPVDTASSICDKLPQHLARLICEKVVNS
ncbi:Nif11-like leader peptide family natural product precursor [Pseudanabaena sp. PCC 6802]|uniref:Nif11-like leader peptide family natural product precursor n=1 Tax=Pseudanabaena sp. PCC 6802 TaxID=118173 RepID=UPI00035C6A4D|nr:Nif11-like leader peptide family natural product precursor [Pseudanabaena sp. PCC 6802]